MSALKSAGTGIALALAALTATSAVAQEAGSRQTREYVVAAGQSDAFEISEAQTVLAQSTDPQVRSFAQRMLQDHRKLSQTLETATARTGLKPPPKSVGADQAPMLGALQGLKGPDLDQAYWHHQALAHHSAITSTQLYAANGDDPAVRQAAAAAVPVIAAHLAMAERMERATTAR